MQNMQMYRVAVDEYVSVCNDLCVATRDMTWTYRHAVHNIIEMHE